MMVNQPEPYSSYLSLDWSDKPENVQACTTLISGGVSLGDFAEYNLATHVGDDIAAVRANRAKLVRELRLPSEPLWLEQIHSDRVFLADHEDKLLPSGSETVAPLPQADASVTGNSGVVCAVLTADCLPVFLCNRTGTEVAVAHAGWRGLHAGVISNTVSSMASAADQLVVSLGPAIGPQAFEVGAEVMQAFVDKNHLNKTAFKESGESRYLCDIYELARIELQALGVDRAQIKGGDYCTYTQADLFYSFRRRQQTGRMANLIWLL